MNCFKCNNLVVTPGSVKETENKNLGINYKANIKLRSPKNALNKSPRSLGSTDDIY